jgi:hypothetical protein
VTARRFALGVILVLCGCGRADPAWIDEAMQAHERADRSLATGNRSAARAALVGFLQLKEPRHVAADDRRRILQDVLFRVADLDAPDDPHLALSWIDRGLAIGQGTDVFTANLWIARGQAHERLGEDRAAAEDYHLALQIDEALLKEGDPQ